MRKLQQAYAKHGFEIVGIANDESDTLKQFFEEKGALPWPNILDSKAEIADQYKIEAFPTYLLIDQKGQHFATPWSAGEIGALVAEKLGVEPVPLP